MINQVLLGALIIFSFQFGEARIRLRKVKDSPRVCTYMKMDPLLGRLVKPVWSTERHSIVVSDDILLVNDLGQKVCSWDKTQFSSLGEINNFRFYIDEYQEVIYPYLEMSKANYFLLKIPFKSCTIEHPINVSALEFPKCDKPKKNSAKKRKKKTA